MDTSSSGIQSIESNDETGIDPDNKVIAMQQAAKSTLKTKVQVSETINLMTVKDSIDSLRQLVLTLKEDINSQRELSLKQHQDVLTRLTRLEEAVKTRTQEKSSFFGYGGGITVKPIFGTKRKSGQAPTHIDDKKTKLETDCSQQQSDDQIAVQKSDQMLEIKFRLPFFGITQPLSKREIEETISRTLWSSVEEDPVTYAALMIHTLNKNKTKVENCVQTLVRILNNIITHPSDPANLQIHQKGEIYQNNLVDVIGVNQFLLAAGFEENKQQECYKMDPDNAQVVEFLTMMKDTLINTTPLSPVLERNTKVYCLSNSSSKLKDLIKSVVSDTLLDEESKDEQKPRYLYCVVGVYFPDGFVLQGLFKTSETSTQLYEFVKENMLDDSNSFSLTTEAGLMLQEQDHVTLEELLLVPEGVLNLSWGPDFLRKTSEDYVYLKPEVLAAIEFL